MMDCCFYCFHCWSLVVVAVVAVAVAVHQKRNDTNDQFHKTTIHDHLYYYYLLFVVVLAVVAVVFDFVVDSFHFVNIDQRLPFAIVLLTTIRNIGEAMDIEIIIGCEIDLGWRRFLFFTGGQANQYCCQHKCFKFHFRFL